jgi:hypothetical protein
MPITVVAQTKAWTVFACSNAGIMGSNSTLGIDVCVRLFCVCVVLCVGRDIETAWSPVQGVLPTVYVFKKLKKAAKAQERVLEPLYMALSLSLYIYIYTVYQVKKVRLSLCLTNYALRHEDVWGSGCINPHFLGLGTSWRWVVSFTPLPLYPLERAPVPSLQDIGWTPEPVWTIWRSENFLTTSGLKTPSPLLVQSVASGYTDWAIPAPYIYIYIYTHTHTHTLTELPESHELLIPWPPKELKFVSRNILK